MRYEAQHLTPDEILAKAGYYHANRGWQKALHENPRSDDMRNYIKKRFVILSDGRLIPKPNRVIKAHRFHAFVEGNEINLHFDKDIGNKRHQSKKFAPYLKPEIEHFQFLDEQGVN